MDAHGPVMVAIPSDLADQIGLIDPNHGGFVVAAIERELARRQNPPRRIHLVDEGFAEWCSMLPIEDEDLVDANAGIPVRWVDGHQGWVEDRT